MSDRRVLYVVEGERADPRFLKKMHQVYFNTKPDNIFCYKTCIHHLLESMVSDGEFDGNLDLVSVLRESANNDDLKILDQNFSQVYLIFDMDPQDAGYDPDLMEGAMDFFSDPTVHGKLYLNYPMLESYRHISCLGDDSYLDSTVDADSIRNYKALVNQECADELKHLPKYDKNTFNRLIYLNLRKAQYILSGIVCELSGLDYTSLDSAEILKKQDALLYECGYIYVLNTSLFMPVDLNPSMFFNTDGVI